MDRARTLLLAIIAAIAVTWFLRLTYVVAVPLVTGCFIAAVVWPVYRLVCARAPRGFKWLALPASMTIVILAVVAFVGAIVAAAAQVIARAPRFADAASHALKRLHEWGRAHELPLDRVLTIGDGSSDQFWNWMLSYLTAGLTSLWSLGGFLVLIFFFAAMMLHEANRWAQKTRAAFPDERAWKAVDTTRTIAVRVREYLLTQTLISAISGLLEGGFCWLMGVELWPVWGLLFFLLNFIPNIGSAVAMVPPTLLALATLGPGWAAGVLGGFIVMETAIGYAVAPLWQGRNLSISPLVVLLSVVFWGWVWGSIGTVLGVPMTASILIACAHFDSLRPIALMLSQTSSHRELDRKTSVAASE